MDIEFWTSSCMGDFCWICIAFGFVCSDEHLVEKIMLVNRLLAINGYEV